MDELDIPNADKFMTHEYIVHQSLAILLIRGGLTWLFLTGLNYLLDRLPEVTGLAASFSTITSGTWAIFHLILNTMFGWLILYVVLSWYLEYYIIREDAVICKKGIIFSKEDVYQMGDISTIDVTQDFFGKLFKYGTVKFYMYLSQHWVYLSNIGEPFATVAAIHSLLPNRLTPEESKRVSLLAGKHLKKSHSL